MFRDTSSTSDESSVVNVTYNPRKLKRFAVFVGAFLASCAAANAGLYDNALCNAIAEPFSVGLRKLIMSLPYSPHLEVFWFAVYVFLIMALPVAIAYAAYCLVRGVFIFAREHRARDD